MQQYAPQQYAPQQSEPRSLMERSALAGLAPGERLLAFGAVVPVKGAKGAFALHHLATRPLMEGVRQEVLEIGATSGQWGSIAGGLPRNEGGKALVMRVTDQRVGLVGLKDGAPFFEVPRSWAARVERRPRLQLMARFRLHYADGSWAAFFTMRRRTV